MRFAVVANLAANLTAAEAILADIDSLEKGVEAIVSAGDVVGHSAHPNEVIELLRHREIRSVRGNYDEVVTEARETPGVDYTTAEDEKVDRLAVAWTKSQLASENMDFLQSLPRHIRINAASTGQASVRSVTRDDKLTEERRNFAVNWLVGSVLATGSRPPRPRAAKRVLVVHGSPRDSVEHLNPGTGLATLRSIAASAAADVIVYGHTGASFQQVVDGFAFISVGSAGNSRVPGRAEYAVIDIVGAEIEVDFRVVQYDAEREARAIERSGLPGELADLMRGPAPT